jgi:small-conductance mechanosensitive channel
MQNITEWIEKTTKLPPELQLRLFTSIAVVLILWMLRTLIVGIVWRKTEDVRIRYRWQKTSSAIAFFIAALVIGRIWLEGVQSLATFFGLLSAGLAIALKDLVTGVAGWIFIAWKRPLSVGDRIQIGQYAGDVVDIGVFKFTLMEIGNWVDADQSTGRILHIPNGMVLNEVVSNYTTGFQYIWNEISVMITFESNWERAKAILHRIAAKHAKDVSDTAQKRLKEASRRFMIFYNILTPTVYTSIKQNGVALTIRYLCEPRHRRGSSQAIWEDILREFAACDDVAFAYPTQRFYDNRLEGKQGTTPRVVEVDAAAVPAAGDD